ncbi:hypothetical protein ACJJTC_004137 [Scirpophaga incertulas]
MEKSRSAAYKPKSGSEKRKNKRKIELQAAASNPKQSRLSFTSTSQELEDPQNRSESQPVPEVIPHLKTLQKYLEMYYDENKEIMEMKALLENDLNIRFDIDHNKIFTLATLLDPRYKQQFFEAEDLITIRSQFLLESLKNSMSYDDSDSGKDDL